MTSFVAPQMHRCLHEKKKTQIRKKAPLQKLSNEVAVRPARWWDELMHMDHTNTQAFFDHHAGILIQDHRQEDVWHFVWH